MMDRSPDPSRLPPELAALDAELGALGIEERASFGPELEAELRRAAARPVLPTPLATARRRFALAASIALLLGAVAARPARATIVALVQRLDRVLPPRIAEVVVDAVAPPESRPPDDIVVELPHEQVYVRTASEVGRPEAADPYRSVRILPPHFARTEEVAAVVARYYPRRMQEEGIGGIVNLLMYIDSAGVAHQPQVNESSNLPELDQAALHAASALRFVPATRNGQPVGMWVRFDLVFEPLVDVAHAVDRAVIPLDSDLVGPPDWLGSPVMPAPIMQETLELLHAALGDGASTARLGSLEGLVHGDPPPGADPVRWRATAASALEAAIQRSPDNPAPFLALARIRRKQGLPAEERALLERGVRRAQRGGLTVSPRLTGELNYELAIAARDAWRPLAHLGRLPADALAGVPCERATVAKAGEAVSPETLIGWSCLCPDQLRLVLDARFEEATGGGEERETMLRSLRAAVAADPAHPGANVELLLDLAERGDASALLNGARRFAVASGGHPYARLLAGLALQHLGRDEEALVELEAGLAGLAPGERERIRDVTPLLDAATAQRVAGMSPAERTRFETGFWAGLDPIASTEVNERRVAHLARSSYAYLRLGGSQTDAGQVWVRYGEPVRVLAFGEGTPLRTELWDYGQGAAITFRRPAASATLDLTAEARAYLADLRTTTPHAPGRVGRVTQPLAAEISHFRDRSGVAEIEVVARVPEQLGSAGTPVEVVTVQLDPRGERLDVQRERSRVGDVLRLKARAKSGARDLAIEILASPQDHAATLHVPFERWRSAPGGRTSDLQLLREAPRGRREVSRGARSLEAAAEDQIVGAQIGALFELYEVPGNAAYQLRVELVPAAGGKTVPLEFRPAGEGRFAPAFTRARWPTAEHVTELLTVRLPDIAPGHYTLRTVADFGAGDTVVVERAVERR